METEPVPKSTGANNNNELADEEITYPEFIQSGNLKDRHGNRMG